MTRGLIVDLFAGAGGASAGMAAAIGREPDIGFRMLTDEELLRAQFGRFANTYSLRAAKNKTDRIRLIGNSVCPEVAEAVVAANVSRDELREVA